MKKLRDFTLDQFVDKLVSWVPADNEESDAPFKGKLKEKSIQKQNLVPVLLQPIIAASNHAKSNESIKEYCKEHTSLASIKRTLESKEAQYKINKTLHEGILKTFTYQLVIKSCSLDLNDGFSDSTSGFLLFFADQLSTLASTIRNSGATTVGAAFDAIANNSKFKSSEPIGKDPDFLTTSKKLFPSNPEKATIKEIYLELVNFFFDDKEYVEAPEMKERNYQKYKNEVANSIDNGSKQIVLTGAPGTGKTKMAKEIAKDIVKANGNVKRRIQAETVGLDDKAKEAKVDKIVKEYIEFVQFHPSYDYTDFVEGLRPVEDGEGGIAFKRIDGIFKRFCRKVAEKENEDKTKNEKYFFLIDEINRADLSKVFGELMYCLESDKRGKKNAVKTPYQNLPTYFPDAPGKTKDVFEDDFYIPENIYIIGTMNDIDRSVESMDFALRRRFLWMEIEVNKEILKGAFEKPEFWYNPDMDTTAEEILKNLRTENAKTLAQDTNAQVLADRVMRMNNIMTNKTYADFGLNEQYYISQGQFANLPGNALDSSSTDNLLKFVWQWRIKPLLREYVRGEDSGKVKQFLEACENALKGTPGFSGNQSNPQPETNA